MSLSVGPSVPNVLENSFEASIPNVLGHRWTLWSIDEQVNLINGSIYRGINLRYYSSKQHRTQGSTSLFPQVLGHPRTPWNIDQRINLINGSLYRGIDLQYNRSKLHRTTQGLYKSISLSSRSSKNSLEYRPTDQPDERKSISRYWPPVQTQLAT